MRIHGINVPDDKRIEIALTYLYGIGRNNVVEILKKAKLDGAKRAKDLSEEDIKGISDALDGIRIEGDLRAEVNDNVRRLKEMSAYRGIRHSRSLPSRGQRTRSNARTKRGKRVTIGAIKKEVVAKIEAAQKTKAAPSK